MARKTKDKKTNKSNLFTFRKYKKVEGGKVRKVNIQN